MKTTLRPADQRGHADHGWLNARHSFSFADYWDPQWHGFHGLRVINEDQVAPGAGFPTHGHRDMEIITWPLAGRLRHADSLGSQATLSPGTAQVMSAGRGIQHSEFNDHNDQLLHLLQIWIEPTVRGAPPRYADRSMAAEERTNRWAIIAAPEGSPELATGALPIRTHAVVSVCDLSSGSAVTVPLHRERAYWLHVVHGDVTIGGQRLNSGDAIAYEDIASTETPLSITAATSSQMLLFDLVE